MIITADVVCFCVFMAVFLWVLQLPLHFLGHATLVQVYRGRKGPSYSPPPSPPLWMLVVWAVILGAGIYMGFVKPWEAP